MRLHDTGKVGIATFVAFVICVYRHIRRICRKHSDSRIDMQLRSAVCSGVSNYHHVNTLIGPQGPKVRLSAKTRWYKQPGRALRPEALI